ncbi:MAG: DUF1674 domain-containing protein [Gammaproteobacteria bacterium]|nr:DUF1674 domain-containing protein [Gammaproteobacteria bacterium]
MPAPSDKNKADHGDLKPGGTDTLNDANETPQPKEIGGRDGPDPTRYGDWEKAGRCIDF